MKKWDALILSYLERMPRVSDPDKYAEMANEVKRLRELQQAEAA
jgi:hypothetical protein